LSALCVAAAQSHGRASPRDAVLKQLAAPFILRAVGIADLERALAVRAIASLGNDALQILLALAPPIPGTDPRRRDTVV
jgi:hypothetical protein